MRFLLRLIVILAVIAVFVYMILPRWSGNLSFPGNAEFQRATEFLRNIEMPQFLRRDQGDNPNSPGSPQPVTRFTWRGDEIWHNGSVISEAEFATLLREVKANGGKVEIIRTSDVTVEAADRRGRLLDEAAVRYEVIPQD